MSSWPSKSDISFGRYFSTHGRWSAIWIPAALDDDDDDDAMLLL